MSLAKAYSPQEVEKKWYPLWEQNRLFHSEPHPSKKPYTIVIPPPNVTGVLHMGHILNNTIQDAYIRYKRMAGFEACPSDQQRDAKYAMRLEAEMASRAALRAGAAVYDYQP